MEKTSAVRLEMRGRLFTEIHELSCPALSDKSHPKIFLIASLWHEEKNSDSFPLPCGQKPTDSP